MSKKPTNAELDIRYATIAEMIVKGQNREDIVRFASKEWNVGDRTVDNYIAQAHSKLRVNTKKEIDTYRDIALSRYEDLYKRNFNIQDYRECRQVQSDIVDLLGIAEAQKLELSGGIEVKKIERTIVDPKDE